MFLQVITYITLNTLLGYNARNQHEAGSKKSRQALRGWFLRNVIFNELHGVISQTIELLITTAVRNLNPTRQLNFLFGGRPTSKKYAYNTLPLWRHQLVTFIRMELSSIYHLIESRASSLGHTVNCCTFIAFRQFNFLVSLRTDT
jgi:hypothetical protein